MKYVILCMIAIVFKFRRIEYVQFSSSERCRPERYGYNFALCSYFCRFLFSFYEAAEERVEKSTGDDRGLRGRRYCAYHKWILRRGYRYHGFRCDCGVRKQQELPYPDAESSDCSGRESISSRVGQIKYKKKDFHTEGPSFSIFFGQSAIRQDITVMVNYGFKAAMKEIAIYSIRLSYVGGRPCSEMN